MDHQVFDMPGQPGLYVGDLITKIDEAPLRGDYDEAAGWDFGQSNVL